MKKSIRQMRLTGDLFDRVRQAHPIAVALLHDGLTLQSAEVPGEYIPCKDPRGLSDQQGNDFSDYMDATFVVGIAVGLLMRPEAFAKGGAK